MKNILVFVMAALLFIPALSSAQSAKYEVVKVTNGGTISGKVTTTAKVKDPVIPIKVKPKETPEQTEHEKKTCITHGEGQMAMMYILSPANEVKNTLVILEDVKKGKAAPKQELVIDNHNCRFEPLIGIAYLNSEYVIKNSDPLLHNTNLGIVLEEGKRRTVYNLALPHQNQVIKKPNRTAGFIQVKCDAHAWMRAYIYSSRHPYAAITDANGRYEIKDLLPGKYTVTFWHEGFEGISKEIEVKAGEVSAANAAFEKTRTPDILAGK